MGLNFNEMFNRYQKNMMDQNNNSLTERLIGTPSTSQPSNFIVNPSNNNSNSKYDNMFVDVPQGENKSNLSSSDTTNKQTTNNGIFSPSAYAKYATDNPDTPDAIKPIGFALESPFRIPLVNRIVKAITGDSGLADNAPVKTNTTDTGNDIVNKGADIVGQLAGFGLKPRLMGAEGVNLITPSEGVASAVDRQIQAAGSKASDNITNDILKSLLSSSSNVVGKAARGAIDGGVGNVLYDMSQNKQLSDIPNSALQGALFGGALGGVAGAGIEGFNKVKNIVSPDINFGNLDGYESSLKPNIDTLKQENINTPNATSKGVIEAPSVPVNGEYQIAGLGNTKVIGTDKNGNIIAKAETGEVLPIRQEIFNVVATDSNNFKPTLKTPKTPITEVLQQGNINTLPNTLKSNTSNSNAISNVPKDNSLLLTDGRAKITDSQNNTMDAFVSSEQGNNVKWYQDHTDGTIFGTYETKDGLKGVIVDTKGKISGYNPDGTLPSDYGFEEINRKNDFVYNRIKAAAEEFKQRTKGIDEKYSNKNTTSESINNIPKEISSELNKSLNRLEKLKQKSLENLKSNDIGGSNRHRQSKNAKLSILSDSINIEQNKAINLIREARTKGYTIPDNIDKTLIKLSDYNSKGEYDPIKPIEEVKKTIPKPVTENIKPPVNEKPSIGATDRTKMMIDTVTGDNKEKKTLKQKASDLYTHLVDETNPTKKVGEDTHMLALNSKKSSGTVSHILNNALVDTEGNNIGESLKSIAKDIPKNEEPNFFNYVFQRHNIDRAREGKPVDPSFTAEQSQKAVKIIEQHHPEYKPIADRLVKFTNSFMDAWGNKTGLVSDELWNNLQDMYKSYIPTNRGFSELEEGVSRNSGNGRGFVDQSNPLQRATGSERDVINPIEGISNLVNRTVRTARYNEVGQTMIENIRNNPDKYSKFAEIIPSSEVNSNVKNIVTVLENGKDVNVRINNKDLLAALQGLYKSNDLNAFETKVKTFNNVFKSLITTKNPVFALRNIARDVPTAYINGSESNPIKFMSDLLKAGKDLATNSEAAQKYKAVGGEAQNFFNLDKSHITANELMDRKLLTEDRRITGSKSVNPIIKGLKKAGDGIEWFNNLTESAPRLAEFKRVLEKTGDVQQALYAAGEVTTNFSRGGDITKKLDIGVPYLNAGVQGLDKLARQFKNRPIATVLKGATSITAPTLLINYINKDNENYKQLDNRTKDNYYLFPQKDGTFIKIPKSREFGVIFGSLAERTLRALSGEDNAFKGFGGLQGTVATNFSPANPLENNIASPILNLTSNKDFAGRFIVPQAMIQDNRSPYLQYDEKTTEPAKALATVANKIGLDLSPKQIDYIVKSYTGVIAQLGQPALTKSTMNSDSKIPKLLKPITSQFTADPTYSNQVTTDFYDNLDKAKRTATDNNIVNNIPSKTVTAEEKKSAIFTKAQTEISKLNKELDKAQANNDDAQVKIIKLKILKIMDDANKGNIFFNRSGN